MPNINNERNLIKKLLKVIFDVNNNDIISERYPEEENNSGARKVDGIYFTKKGDFVVEHTKLETYIGQITENYKIEKLLDCIETEIKNKLKKDGKYILSIPAGSLKNINIKKHSKKIFNWILSNSDTILIGNARSKPNHFKNEVIKNMNIELYLFRWPSEKKEFFIRRFNDESLIKKSISKAFIEKTEKLLKYGNYYNSKTILLLESNDISGFDIMSVYYQLEKFIKGKRRDIDYIVLCMNYNNFGEAVVLNKNKKFRPNYERPILFKIRES